MSHETRTDASRYRWKLKASPSPASLERSGDLHPLVLQILHSRGLTDPDAIRAFLDGTPDDDNPFRLHGVNEAVTRIRSAIRQSERIAVYGDFDVDGVTSTALLIQVLRSLGARAEPYIPHRIEEGYGLNTGALDKLAGRGISLVITVDCGIRAIEQVQHGRRLGLDLIITDHHEPVAALPPAVAVIDPKLPGCRYDFEYLPGVGLAFKLAQALLRVEGRVPLGTARGKIDEEELLDLVALGVVADLAKLIGENRSLVRRGLTVLNRAERLGVRALMDVAGAEPGHINSETIGYVLGPRLNAAGRLDHAMLAYRLLVTRDPAEARALAEKLDARNRERRALTQQVLEQALAQVEGEESAFFLIVGGQDFVPGIVGLVASRLTERFYRPSLALEIGDEISRGSARSIPEFNVVAALDEVADLLIKHGGHKGAAGLTVATKKLDELRSRLTEIAARKLADEDLAPELEIDLEWPLSRLETQTFYALTTLEPFGIDNPAPLLLARDVALRDFSAVGDERNHLRLKLEQERIVWDAIAFRQGHWADNMPAHIDIVYTPQIDVWNGQEQLQLNVKDIRATGSTSIKT
ncbi:MAG: Single-stranded-DNA-specific exonuclease RecJ [Anaerolineales bacterium]|nr:Single-stranded-DNA-specific exonuclease RecJ [Anaerolineales bacterium]